MIELQHMTHNIVMVFTLYSITKHIFTMTAQIMLKASATFKSAEFFFVSTVLFHSV